MGSKVIRNITKVFRSASGVLFGRKTAGTGRGEELTPSDVRTLISVYSTSEVDTIIGGIGALTSSDIDTLAEINAILTDADLASVTYVDGLASNYATAAQGALADSALQPADIASGTITARADDVNLSGGSDGDVLTVQADGSLALETPSGGGIGGSTGSTANRVLTSDGTGGSTLQASLVEIDTNGKVSASVSAAETITAHTTSGIFVSLSGTVTNNTSNGLRRSAVCVTNTSTVAGTAAVVKSGVEIVSNGATNDLCLALITPGNAIFIGSATPAVSAQTSAALHSVSVLTRQFLFNRAEIGTAATDGTYYSCGSDGTFLIWNQENANLRFGTNGADSLTLLPTYIKAFKPVLVQSYTVATLPSASTFDGCIVRVTDSNVAASGNYGATVAGGGANKVKVFSDGTNWVIA